MTLSDAIAEATKHMKPKSPYCNFYRLYLSFSKEDQKILDVALTKYGAQVIVRALRAEGHAIGKDIINHHKKGICRCPKEEANDAKG